jgi:hypothetical protein
VLGDGHHPENTKKKSVFLHEDNPKIAQNVAKYCSKNESNNGPKNRAENDLTMARKWIPGIA